MERGAQVTAQCPALPELAVKALAVSLGTCLNRGLASVTTYCCTC